MKYFKILFILTFAFIALSVETDVYVPSFPDMVRDLQVNETSIQMILSLNFLGICLSCLLSGPLSDSYGRQKILSIGTGLFAVASLACYLSNDFGLILLARFIQGLGAGTIMAVACSCIFDLYPPAKSGQLIAILNAATTIAMSCAPLIGVWLNIQYGWKSTFLFILILATITWLAITFVLPETLPLPKRSPFRVKTVFINYLDLLKSKKFVLGSIIWCSMFATLIVYTSNSSLLFIEHLGVSEQSFAYYQSITMGAFALASLACSYLVGKLGGRVVKIFGTSLFLLGIINLLLVNMLFANSPVLISLAMALVSAGTALAAVVYFTDSMTDIPNAGAAVSLAQGLRLFLCSEFTDISRIVFDGSLQSILIVLAGVTLVILTCMLFLPKTRSPTVLTAFAG